jgi:hypothetical protein
MLSARARAMIGTPVPIRRTLSQSRAARASWDHPGLHNWGQPKDGAYWGSNQHLADAAHGLMSKNSRPPPQQHGTSSSSSPGPDCAIL